ncbi:MAG TPA: cation-transporting P-type ATPase, partial [Dehalococcoidia bacterium]
MATTMAPPTSTNGHSAPHREWYRMNAGTVAGELGVATEAGLPLAAVTRRRQEYGPNRLAEKEKEPGWQAFLRQYQDLMQLVLLGAAVVNQIATGETGTTLVLIGLTLFNAVLGLKQEAKAEAALASLQQMMKSIARVRRDGQVLEVAA